MTLKTKIIALVLALAMFLFSSYMYVKTGDWVAAVFVVGSIGYALFFFLSSKNHNQKEHDHV
ncbi:MAG: hypothetical protein V7742_14860 [Halioglobus sp.]